MAKLQDDYKNQKALRSSGEVLYNLEQLTAQEAESQGILDSVKATIKTEVAADNFSETNFLKLLQSQQRLTGIYAKRVSLKAQMAELKKDLKDAGHKQDLQDEIDKLS